MARRGLASITLAVALIWAGCEKLGDVRSGQLACSAQPRNLCPTGFFCSAGRCWKNGSPDASLEMPSGDVHAEAGSADESGWEADAIADVAEPRDTGSTTPDANTATSEDAPATDVKTEAGPTCGICPSPPSSGHSTCNGTTCGIACDSGYRNCPGTEVCLANSACCADSECPKNTPACVSGQCKARANNDACSSDTECGSGHCAATASGAATKVCCDSDCSGSCNDGCAGGTCQHKKFRTACGEIDNAPYAPRYLLCDGNGTCNPPSFRCHGTGDVCASTKDVLCCADPNNGYMLACVTPATCASQNSGDFEMSCGAAIDCPAGSFCCSEQNQTDVFVSGCGTNCQAFSTHGRDPTQFAHNQLCDPLRDPGCPVGLHCQVDPITGLGMCSP